MAASKPSKSARKKEQLALQSLGEALIDLSDDELASIELDEALREAVTEARTISARGALRRQKQLIGKLMRNVDPAPLRAALERLGRSEQLAKERFRRSEKWRDRLVSEGQPALEELERETGRTLSALANLLSELDQARDDGARRRIGREIFRALHRELTARGAETPGLTIE